MPVGSPLPTMHEIDGSAGGGQVLRTAVTLSALSGEAVRVDDIRGDRPDPGMRPQHVASVEAAAALCGASLTGAEHESETLTFEPGAVAATDATVEVGTAGSVALVFDTILPLATALSEPASVTVTGGTDVRWAPPMAYLRHAKLPLLREAGLAADVAVESRGFYPVGEGEATLSMEPSALSPVEAAERGALRRLEIYSAASEGLADADVAERQAAAAATGADPDAPVVTKTTYAEAASAGSALVVTAVYETGRAGFSALGEAGKPSERVASEAVEAFETFRQGGAAVDRHMADQLSVYLALAGGEVLVPAVTDHAETNRSVVEHFGYDLAVERRDDCVLLSGEP